MEEKRVLAVSVYPELYQTENRARKVHQWEQIVCTLNVDGIVLSIFFFFLRFFSSI